MSTAPEPRSARRSSGRAARPQVDEDTRRERLEQFHATLSEQVLTLTSSTAWTNWLQTAARFHHYSLNNTLSIWLQRPDATHVAGYRTWQSLGRQVRKGEQGIQILAPVTRRAGADAGADADAGDTGSTGRPAERTGDRPEGESSPRRMVGVRIAHVFDYSQTEGQPLADLEAIRPTLLTGQAPDRLWDGLALQVAEAGFQLGDEALSNGANGRTNFTDRTVLLRPELDPAQRVKTLTHELAHVSLHAPQDGVDGPATLSCRGRQEVEAESVAFLVASAHGMDTASYSFPYVAGWAQHDGDNVEATLRETAGRALSTAHRILDRLDRDNPAPLPVAEDAAPVSWPVTPVTPARLDGAAHQRRAAPGPARTPDVGMRR